MKLKVKKLVRLLLRFLRPLGTVEGTGLSPAIYASSIQSSSKDVVTYTRKVLYTTATDQHDAVLLEVVALAQTDTRYLTHSGVRLLRRRRVNTQANATLLRASIQCTGLAVNSDGLAPFAN